MPFKLRLKKSRQYNVVSKNLFVISVELIDKTTVECTLSAESTGRDCLDNVCQRQGVAQSEFFGLRMCSKRPRLRWVDLEKPLKRQLEKYSVQETSPLYLRVMFYVSDIRNLQDEMTRDYYFMQLKSNIVEGLLPCNPEQAVMLASYSLQAEFGDHDPERHTTEYLKSFFLLPKNMTIDENYHLSLIERIVQAHRGLQGVSPTMAEVYYIMEAIRLEGYGQEYLAAKDSTGSDNLIGICMLGVFVKRPNARECLHHFKWADITNLRHPKRALEIECEKLPQPVNYQMEDAEVAKYAWKLCVLQHSFYMKNKNLSDSQDIAFANLASATSTLSLKDSPQQFKRIYNENEFTDLSTCNFDGNPFPGDTGPFETHNPVVLEAVQRYQSQMTPGPSTPTPPSTMAPPVGFEGSVDSLATASAMAGSYGSETQLSTTNTDQLRAMLPSYRPAPDYDTAVQQTYGSRSNIYKLPADTTTGIGNHYKNFTDLANINSAQLYGHHRTVPDLTHTYSTPDLTSGRFLAGDPVNQQFLGHLQHIYNYKPVPQSSSYPYGQSSSTPDLAARPVTGQRHVMGSTPDLLARHTIVGGGSSVGANGGQGQGQGQGQANETSSQLEEEEEEEEGVEYERPQPRPRKQWGGGVPARTSLENFTPREPVDTVNRSSGSAQSMQNVPQVSCIESQPPVPLPRKKNLSKRGASNGLMSNVTNLKIPSADVGVAVKSKDNLCPTLESKLTEGLVFMEFEQIPRKRHDAEFTTSMLAENSGRNRFKDVLPYEDNRVLLTPTKDNRTGYINASHVSVTIGNQQRFYIAAQGPLPATVVSFWQMVWEQQVHVVVMLTEIKEMGSDKCFPYWPQDDSIQNRVDFGEYQIVRKFSTRSTCYVTCALTVTHTASKRQRNVWQIQYTDWPDHGCPEDVQGFLGFMDEIDSVRRHASSEVPPGRSRNLPLLVHCSAGVGRSGVTILSDIMIYSLDHNETVEIPKMLNHLRQQRMLTVQTLAQYKFIYQVLIQYLRSSRLI